MAREGNGLFHDLVDVELEHLRLGPLRELADLPNHFASAVGVLNYFPDAGDRLLDVRTLAAQPAQVGFAVGH